MLCFTWAAKTVVGTLTLNQFAARYCGVEMTFPGSGTLFKDCSDQPSARTNLWAEPGAVAVRAGLEDLVGDCAIPRLTMRTKQNSARDRVFMNCPSNAVRKMPSLMPRDKKPDRPLNSFK